MTVGICAIVYLAVLFLFVRFGKFLKDVDEDMQHRLEDKDEH